MRMAPRCSKTRHFSAAGKTGVIFRNGKKTTKTLRYRTLQFETGFPATASYIND
jgi:hypothetical protein